MPFDPSQRASTSMRPLLEVHERNDVEEGYTFELQGLSKDVTAESLHALFDRDAPSIKITLSATSPPSSAATSTSAPSLPRANSTSFLLKPATSFNRSAELRVRTLGEAVALQNMQPRLETYGLSLLMRGRASGAAGLTRGASFPGTGMQAGAYGYGGGNDQWLGVPRDDSGVGVSAPRDSVLTSKSGGMGMGMWRESKGFQGDAYADYDTDDQIPVMSSWSPWGNTTHTAPPLVDPEADRMGPRNLYVLNLPVSLSQIEFEEMFAKIGNVEHACLLSMLDQNGRRRGFLLMRTHKEAREVIKQAHGRMLDGCQLDISWARVQKGAASEIQRGSSHGMQRFLPPPLAPQPHMPPQPIRPQSVSYPTYRPSTGWTMSSTIARHPEHPSHTARFSRPFSPETDFSLSPLDDKVEYNLASIIVVQPLLSHCTLHSVTTEASKYGNITHSCILSLGKSAFAPFNDYHAHPDSPFATSFAIRFHHTASAETATRMLPVLHGWQVRPADCADIDRLPSTDRQMMLYSRGPDRSSSGLAPAPTYTSPLSMLDGLHAKPFQPSAESTSTPRTNRKPALFTTPISPLSAYPKQRDVTAAISHEKDKLARQESIWKQPSTTWSRAAFDPDDDDEDPPLPPTPIIKSTKQDPSNDLLSPSAVWWTGALRLDDDEPITQAAPDPHLSIRHADQDPTQDSKKITPQHETETIST